MQPRDHAVAARASKASRSGAHPIPIELRESSCAQAALERKYRAYYELYESAPIAYFVTDASGVITNVNRQACTLLNAGSRFLAGKTLTSLVTRADRARLRDLIAVMSDVVLHTELRVQPRAEDAAWVSVIAQRVTTQDDGVRIRWLMRSASVQKQEDARRDAAAAGLQTRVLELEAHARRIGHLLKREQEARRDADERLVYKDRALAGVARDLAGPLRVVQSWLELVDQEPLDPRARKQTVAHASRCVEDLVHVVDDLNDHARSDAHQAMLTTVEPLDLTILVAEVIEELRVLASAKRISLELTATAYGILMHGDPRRLRQVFRTLLDNAINLTPDGGHVRFDVIAGDGHAEVVVTDTGRGIEPEALATIFEPFAHARVPAGRKDGLGLGLSIAKRLVQLHGGSIQAYSAGAGQGASFAVRLPVS